jgi:phosphoglycerol geranylgeranyltransferase
VKTFYQTLQNIKNSGQKALAVLLDPDKLRDQTSLEKMMELIRFAQVDFVFVGGSLLVEDNFHECLGKIKKLSTVPVVLFPGSPSQISKEADSILFLSLISGRNPDLLIGQHVVAAPMLKKLNLEIVPTGYMLVDCGNPTTASYVSQTLPIPWNKPEIAAATAMAGEMLGLSAIYIDGGSGASKCISESMVRAVRQSVELPIIVGGGIRNESQAAALFKAGADLVVIGTVFEEEPELLFSIGAAKKTREL